MKNLFISGTSVFLMSLFSSFYLVRFFRTVAIRFNILDAPDGAIKRHKQPVPYLGGLAIYGGLLCGLIISFPVIDNVLFFWIGITLLLFLGLMDDLVPLRPYQKFGGQLLIVICLLRSGIYLKEHFFSNYWNMAISGLWILTIVNGFNLIDVMDGLATTVALGATCAFMLISFILEQYEVVTFLMAFLGSLIAFLWYNFPPATIYMGDAGSLFIGGVLAVIPFFIMWGRYNVHGYLTPLLILSIPLVEVMSLICIRTYKGIPFYRGSSDHFCHYLQKKGWSKKNILAYMVGISAFHCVLAGGYICGFLSILQLVFIIIAEFCVWSFVLYL